MRRIFRYAIVRYALSIGVKGEPTHSHAERAISLQQQTHQPDDPERTYSDQVRFTLQLKYFLPSCSFISFNELASYLFADFAFCNHERDSFTWDVAHWFECFHFNWAPHFKHWIRLPMHSVAVILHYFLLFDECLMLLRHRILFFCFMFFVVVAFGRGDESYGGWLRWSGGLVWSE